MPSGSRDRYEVRSLFFNLFLLFLALHEPNLEFQSNNSLLPTALVFLYSFA